MDEISLYNRALSAAEIQSIVAADLSGKCLAPPVVTQQPQDQIIPLGEDVKFTVGVSGNRPLTYQWYFNGGTPQNKIIGATNATLLIEKVRTTNAGLYFVTVTNSLGFATSFRVTLSTLPAPSCVETLPGLISWWPADFTSADVIGGNGAANYSPAIYPTGKVGTAFTFNGASTRISVNTTNLNFSTNQNFSIEMWIKAANTNTLNPNVPLLEKRETTSTAWIGYSLSLYDGRLAFALGAALPFGSKTNKLFISPGPDLRDALFHHVAVTINRTNSNGGVLYVDGLPVMVFDPRAFTNVLFNPFSQSPLFMGGPTTTISNSYFMGLIDEPAIYGRALSPLEILAIRNAGTSGRCKTRPTILVHPANILVQQGSNTTLTVQAVGTPNLSYQWFRNSSVIPRATNTFLNITNITATNAGTYAVIVFNYYGEVMSSNAIVAVSNRPPTAVSSSFSVLEDRPIDVLLTGTDPEQNPLTYVIVTQPTNGVLSGQANSRFRIYTPNPNYNGPDFFTYKVNDGFSDSPVATMSITVLPVNDPPVAFSEQFGMDEDSSLPIQLRADDVDSDKLAFEIVQQPAHGALTGTGPKRIYTPAQDYFGDDYFTFTARDGSNAVSPIAIVSITVRPVNDAPVARIVLSPLDTLPGETNTVLIAPACCDALLTLDGSQSSDVENDSLTYIWLDGTNIIATTATFTNRFGPGVHEFTLIVSDGALEDTASLTIEILKTEEAVLHLQTLVETAALARNEKAALVNWLRVTITALEHCNVEQAVTFLERFEQRVAERIAPLNPASAAKWIETSRVIRSVAGYCDPAHRPGSGNNGQDKGSSKQEQEQSANRGNSEEVRAARSSPR